VKHIDAFCPTLCWFPYSSSFALYWLSPTPFQSVCLTSMLGKSIREHLVSHSDPPALGSRDPRCHCLALYQIQPLPGNSLCCHLHYPSCHSSLANVWCPKCIQVCDHCNFWLDNGRFIWFSGHLIFEFILQGGPLQTKPVAKVIFLTLSMHPHHHVERVTRCFDDLFRIQNVSYGCHLLIWGMRFLLCST